ncbi:MAG: class IIb bacteriocin, lactobin A/cerein 7B family [Holophagales bacterium]|nr:class IIb bacteriocin, lactobin A/cerein 7B family [Holophagales bacterium]
MSQNLEARNRAEAELIRQAWADEGFKKKLLADPKPVYASAIAEAGGDLDGDTEVHALEESSTSLYLIIPSFPVEASGDLDERSTRGELESVLISRAQKDAAFKHELIADPKAAYEAQLASVRENAALPEGLKVEVKEEAGKVVYFRLPEQPSQSGELSEEDLQNVAGGAAAVGVAIASTVVVGAVAAAVLLATPDEPFEPYDTLDPGYDKPYGV